MTDKERWKRINDIFEAALDLSENDRQAYLEQECAADKELLAEVTSLLSADQSGHSLLDGLASDVVDVEQAASETGKQVGAYKIIKQIGTGGMGAVYLAERTDGQFKQKVALKLIKRGMDSEEILRRFQSERQILAGLQHPNIARLLDGGITEDGLPFFTMEHIEGTPIDLYCDNHRLSIDRRLALFQDVCEAVSYAQQNLIVHRDLKPANILITESGEVKLLDFGIAKLLLADSEFDESSSMTHTGMRMMTPGYAAPEQVRGETVTTSTDVYSLGIVLYQLLTGRHPYHKEGSGPAELERAILTTIPVRPSAAVTDGTKANDTSKATAETIGASRKINPLKLRRRLRGDLDNICLKALRKEPDRRYQSAEQFLTDIKRHINGLPVLARRDTFGYRATKFITRHKSGLVATVITITTLLTLLFVHTMQLEQERDRAQIEAEKAKRIAEFLVDLFEVSDPDESQGETVTARELLQRGSDRIDQELAGLPEVQAMLSTVVGKVYHNLALYKDARPLLEHALVLNTQVFGISHPEVARSMTELASLIHESGEDKNDSSLILLEKALAIQQGLFKGDHEDIANTLITMGYVYELKWELPRSESLYVAAADMHQRLLGADNKYVVEDLSRLAGARRTQRDFEGSQQFYEKALLKAKEQYGETHTIIADIMSDLAVIYKNLKMPNKAEPYYRDALEMRSKLLGDDSRLVAQTMNNYAVFLRRENRLEEAEKLARTAIPMYRRALGNDHWELAHGLNNLASILRYQGRLDEAESLYKDAVETYERSMGPDYWGVAYVRTSYGICLKELGRLSESEKHLLLAYEKLGVAQGSKGKGTIKAINELVALYDTWNKPQQAEIYRKKLSDTTTS